VQGKPWGQTCKAHHFPHSPALRKARARASSAARHLIRFNHPIIMEFNVERLELLLLTAAIVAMLARRLRIPYTVGLVVAGGLLALLPAFPAPTMTKELIFTVLLPPLIFEAAISLDWQELRVQMPVVTAMATLGVVLAVAVTALGMVLLAGWPPMAAAIFAVLISATDPVSVIATFKESGVHGRIRLLVEAESLFNDGTAAVGFGLVLAVAAGGEVSVSAIGLEALLTIGGGVACGIATALVVRFLLGRTNDHLVEITFMTVAAYGAFLLAEHFHWSGVLSTLAAGLVIGNGRGREAISRRGKEAVDAFWEYAAFVANSLVFLLIGLHETRQPFGDVWRAVLVAIFFVMLGRAAAIYPVSLLFRRTAVRVSMPHQHLMFWGGLRGALALALALGLPEGMPYREQIVTVAFAVVAFSVIVQGMTMLPLLRYFGELPSK